MMKSVAIIGGAHVRWTSWYHGSPSFTRTPGRRKDEEVPWDDPNWDRWCCNALYTLYPTDPVEAYDGPRDEDLEMLSEDLGYGHKTYPVTGWFQLHTPEYMRKHWAVGFTTHEIWLERAHDFPIYMQKHYRNYPSSVKFPREKVEAICAMGPYQIYTFSWMFAFAIAEGYERIGLFGAGAGPSEPLAARACMEFWIGYAMGKGIEVLLCGTPTLFQSHHRADLYSDLQYAYDDEPAFELGNGWRDVR